MITIITPFCGSAINFNVAQATFLFVRISHIEFSHYFIEKFSKIILNLVKPKLN